METPTLPTNWLAALSNANHVRKHKIGQNSLTSLKLSSPASDFRSCRRLFRMTFCNFAAKPLSIQIDWQNEISVYN